MENFDENIENEYRGRFSDFEEMPDDTLWKNIQTRIKPEEERPFVIWWNTMRGPAGIAASILIGLLIGAYFLIKPDSTQQISDLTNKPDTSISQTKKTVVTQEDKPAESKTNPDNKISNETNDESKQLTSVNVKKAQKANNVVPMQRLNNPQSPIVNKEANETIAQVTVEKEANKQEENKSAVAVINPNPESRIDKPIVAQTKQSEEEKAVLANATEQIKEDAKAIAEEKADESKLAINQNPKQIIPNPAVPGNEENHPLALKDTLFQRINVLNGKEAYQLAVAEKKLTAPELPAAELPLMEEEEKRRLVFIPPTEIFANVTSTLSYYRFAPNKGDQILVENFSSSSQRLGFAAQLGFVYPIAKKMDLRTGLSYFSGKSRISYGVTDNSQKSVTVLNDNSVQINPGNATKNENRNWQYFELQSDILYEVKKMQALSLGMKLGVQTSAVNNPLLQARVGYRLSKAIAQHWALWLEPSVSVSLSSHRSVENLFMYRTTGFGLNMGVSLLR